MADRGVDQVHPDDRRREVVVAVDGSEGSRLALRWAGQTAVAAGAPLRVVQSWEYPATLPFPWSRVSSPAPETVDDDVRSAVSAMVDEELPAGGLVHVEVLRGPAAAALVAMASEAPPRMLVLGSRGRGGFAGLLLGSVSRQCLAHAPCPVVVVPGPERGEVATGLNRVVVGMDGSAASAQALRFSLELAAGAKSEVLVVHAFEPTFSEIPPDIVRALRQDAEARVRDEWCARLADEDVVSECMIVDGDPRQVLVDVAIDQEAGLIL
jgi:nucleotide-binding universal stress UspA family protein